MRDAFPNENTPLGPFLGNLPVDVLRVVLGLLTPFERALFARAGGACYRVAKQSGLGRAGVSSRDIKQLMHMDELTASMSVFTWSLSNLGDPDKTVTRVIFLGHTRGMLTCGMIASGPWSLSRQPEPIPWTFSCAYATRPRVKMRCPIRGRTRGRALKPRAKAGKSRSSGFAQTDVPGMRRRAMAQP